MKAKLIKSWDFYKVSIKEGTEVNIIKGMEADADSVLNAPYGMCYYIPATLLTITDWANIDWEQRRYEIAKSAVQGFCSNSDKEICKESPFIKLAQWAVSAADALIAELKKGGAQ